MHRSVLVIALIALSMTIRMGSVLADHADGHLYDWDGPNPGVLDGLQQRLIGGTVVSACTGEFPQAAQAAINRWNIALGFTAFSWITPCSSAQVIVLTTGYNLFCTPASHACTIPKSVTGDPWYSINNPTNIYFNPSLFPGTYPDGSAHLSRDVTHEFGHVLGHADYSGCPSGPTLMDTTETCWYETPQTLDVNNYASAYFVDAVAGLQGSSPSVGTVSLTWDAGGVHNEDGFVVQRDGVAVGSAAKNANSWSGSNQPGGSHTYTVVGHTNAWCLAYGGYCASASYSVVVQGAVDYEPTGYTPNPACGSCNEGGAKSFTISVRNNGNVTAPVSTVVMKFNGQTAPNPYGGVCNLPEIPAGETRSCTNISPVSLTFQGGTITLHADYTNVVPNESNETNNNSPGMGTMYVVPNAPSNPRVCPTCDLYGYKDNSGIETGFTIQVQRRSGGCGSSGWSTVSTVNHGPKSGTDDVYYYNFTSGYCWRIKVSSKTQFASNEVTSPAVNFP